MAEGGSVPDERPLARLPGGLVSPLRPEEPLPPAAVMHPACLPAYAAGWQLEGRLARWSL